MLILGEPYHRFWWGEAKGEALTREISVLHALVFGGELRRPQFPAIQNPKCILKAWKRSRGRQHS
jgi:hypothetical protein